MKFMILSIFPIEKTAEMALASDKVWAGVPRERRPQVGYGLMCVPFAVPANSTVTFSISEIDDAETMAARMFPLMLAGATVNIIPLLELPIAGTAKFEKKLKA